MNKKSIRIAGWTLGLALALGGVGVAAASSHTFDKPMEAKATSADWQLVTAAPADWSGTYLLANNSSGTVKIMDATSLANSAFSAVTGTHTVTSEGKLLGIDDSYAIVVSPSKAGTANKYTVQAGSNYIGKNANNNGVDAVATTGTYTANYNNSISFGSNNIVTIAGNGGRTLTWYGSNSNFKYYASSNNCTRLFRKIDLTKKITISAASVSGLKTETNTSVSVTVSNFTATGLTASYKDGDAADYSTTPGVVSVSGTKNGSGNYDLTINYLSVGTSTVKLTVTDGTSNYEGTFTVTVAAKPKSIVVSEKAGTPWVDGKLEVMTGGSGSEGYRQVSVTATDTDDAAYTGTLQWSSADTSIANVTSSGRIYGVSAGETTIKVEAKALPSVFDTVTVKVFDDYVVGVSSVGYNLNLTANSGDTLSIENVFASKLASTYFGNTEVMDDNQLLFSYAENDYANAVLAGQFSYICDPSTPAGDAENQVVYVYSTLDPTWSSSFNITVTKTNVAVAGLVISNVEGHAKNLGRNDTFQLELLFDPTNATDKRVTYTIDADHSDEGHGTTVSSSGLVTAGTVMGKKARIVVTSVADNTKTDYVDVTTVREHQTIEYRFPLVASFEKVTTVAGLTNGEYAIVYEAGNASRVFDGGSFTDAGGNYVAATIADGDLAATEEVLAATVTITNTTSGYTIQSHDGKKYITGKGSDNNGSTITTTASYNTITFGEESSKTVALIKDSANNVFRMNPNSDNPRFRFYKSGSYTNQKAVQLYKLSTSGGTQNLDVSDDLFNTTLAAEGHISCNDSGIGSTYNWSDVIAEFGEYDESLPPKFVFIDDSFADLQYAVANKNGNEVEQFLARYDYIVGKYHEDDFLGRSDKDIFSYEPAAFVSFGTPHRNDNQYAIFAVIGAGLLATGGLAFFTYRRRKEHQ